MNLGKQNTHILRAFAEARLAYAVFLPGNVPLVPVNNTVAVTMYRLKLNALCDLL